MATDVTIGYGTVFEMAPEADPTNFTPLGEVTNIDPGEDDDEEVEATHMQSPDRTREYIPGLTTPGTATVEGNYVPGSATDLALIAARGKRNVGRITYPNGVRLTFPVVRRSYATTAPIDDRMTYSATFRRAGATSRDETETPVNAVMPAISGVAAVDEVLTAYPGVWAPFATFGYQWKRDGVNIGGATAATHTVVEADEGTDLTVTVTATNADGSASATSLPVAIPA